MLSNFMKNTWRWLMMQRLLVKGFLLKPTHSLPTIIFVELLGVAPQLYIWAIGFIGGVAVWHIWLCVSITTTATTATALRILRLSHNTCLPVISLLFAGCADKKGTLQ